MEEKEEKKEVYIPNYLYKDLSKDETRANMGKSLFKFLVVLAAGIGIETAIVFAPLAPVVQTAAFSVAGVTFASILKTRFSDALAHIADHVNNVTFRNEMEKRGK
jgi:hypothetical protein